MSKRIYRSKEDREHKLLSYIQGELRNKKSPREIKRALIDGQWPESQVMRILEIALSSPEKRPEAAIALEPVLVLQENGELKMESTLVNAHFRPEEKKDVEFKPVAHVVSAKPFTWKSLLTLPNEQKVLMVQTLSRTALCGLLLFHVWLIVLKYWG